MSKPWDETGLQDFKSWLGVTHARDGLVYRGDADFEQLGPRGLLTVLEFKNAGETLGRGQLNWLRRRGRDERTEVRVVRELPAADIADPRRLVWVWDPMSPALADKWPLDRLAFWVNSRAYRSGREETENLPPVLF